MYNIVYFCKNTRLDIILSPQVDDYNFMQHFYLYVKIHFSLMFLSSQTLVILYVCHPYYLNFL